MCKSGERHDHFQVHPPVSLDDATYLIALGQGVGTRHARASSETGPGGKGGGQRGEGTSATSAVRSLSAVSAIPSDRLEAVACGFCVPPAAAATCFSRACAAASCSRSASLSPLCPFASALNTESANLSDRVSESTKGPAVGSLGFELPNLLFHAQPIQAVHALGFAPVRRGAREQPQQHREPLPLHLRPRPVRQQLQPLRRLVNLTRAVAAC